MKNGKSLLLTLATVSSLLLWMVTGAFAQFNQFDVNGPGGSIAFGAYGTVLQNGNIVVTDPGFNFGTGAVYIYDRGGTQIIGTLTGNNPGDLVGEDIIELSTGAFLVISPDWNKQSGAVTWMDSNGGFFGAVDPRNSLLGDSQGDQVGLFEALPLANGNYVVISPFWDDGNTTDVGAVTWGDGRRGTVGFVSAQNSLVGSAQNDVVGSGFVTVLRNGNYVVRSPQWSDRGAIPGAGAATWSDGRGGTVGPVSSRNSLVGSQANDRVGSGVVGSTNGNYVVQSTHWANGNAAEAGAVTWCDGTRATPIGRVTNRNSLVGTSQGDNVGKTILRLSNGNFVALSSTWDNVNPLGTQIADAGAVSWLSGSSPTVGAVSDRNSLIGENRNDRVGSGKAVALTNGNYAFASPYVYKELGAVTWGDGTRRMAGVVSDRNSMMGNVGQDHVGSGGVIALSTGDYAFASPEWDDPSGIRDVGAATWGTGTGPSAGRLNPSNSVIGTSDGDRVGSDCLLPVANGNYVVCSSHWTNNGNVDAGAATWIPGSGSATGFVSTSNSIFGQDPGDRVGIYGAAAVGSGNYVVVSPFWRSNGVNTDGIGAVTWGDGNSGTFAPVDISNSLVGARPGDRIGEGGVTYQLNHGGIAKLVDGNYVVVSPFWKSAGVDTDGFGAVTWAKGNTPTNGRVSSSNSLVGRTIGDRVGFNSIYGQSVFEMFDLQPGNPFSTYIVYSQFVDDSRLTDVGAVSYGKAGAGTVGLVSPGNSVLGRVQNGPPLVPFIGYLTLRSQLVVGQPGSNLVTLIGP